MSGARLRDAATATTIAGVQNHFDLGDPQQWVTTLRRNAAPDTAVVPRSPSARTRENTAAGRSRPAGERHEPGRIAA
ncbi:hypothetical protein [Nocardia nova]|uniref:hypothetical protein n=1 Tax=Nocardia nova TaxID=37330 RepID=UPI0027382DC2|nr:hypothetical protein [Nocardia nova]